MNKLVEYKNLQTFLSKLKSLDTKTVLVGGCFDILHLGHIRFLRDAKKYGTVIVALESDKTLQKHKGHSRPIHKQLERAEVLANLETTDYILVLPHFSSDQEYFELTKTISPFYIVYTDGDPQKVNKQKQAKAVGAKLIEVAKISTPSTSQLAKLLQIE